MKNIKFIITFSIILLALIGCNSETKDKKESIKIGAIIFETGDAAEYGVWVKNGLEIAKDEINNKGGINGRPIEILYEDDNTNPKNAVSALNKLLTTQNVSIVIAGVTSKSAMALAPYAESKKVVLFSPCASSPDYTNAGDYIFRNWASDDEEGKLMAEYSYNKLGYRNIATVSMNSDYGLGLQKVFSTRFLELGGKIVFTEEFSEGETDFKNIVAKLKNQNFDAIYFPSHAKEVGSFLKQMRQNNQNYKILGCVTYESPELIKIAGSSADGIVFTTPAFNPDSKETAIKNFKYAYEKRFGIKPENFAAHSYDALNIINLAIKNGGNTSEGIKNALYKISKYPGVSGETSFDSHGDVYKPAMIKIIKNQEFISLEIAK
jgi:branched-chain amino acid transport system substrate-binding protein